MGITTSSAANTTSPTASATAVDGEHFNLLINPPKLRPAAAADPEGAVKGPEKARKVSLHQKARLLKRLDFNEVWEGFLQGSASSFALTPSEMQSLLQEITTQNPSVKAKTEQAIIDSEIKDYIALVTELSEKDTSKAVDFMAVCSSVLFLNPHPIEMKVDQIFNWIVLNPELDDFQFEDFLIAISSFERGLSHAMGRTATGEGYVKEVAMQWFALADPSHRGVADPQAKVSQSCFFEFCMNRQHVVRRLLEAFVTLTPFEDKNSEITEIDDTLEQKLLKTPVTAGDEWMANPAWKKTAERMVSAKAAAAYQNCKPSSHLTLEWVHGYRGFDCRNNLCYADGTGQRIAYPAAALAVLQDTAVPNQIHFGEHKDDITCLASYAISPTCSMFASGEIGKTPGICLYLWTSCADSFQTLSCLQGLHTKGISQVSFSTDGKYLFSVGIEYTVAVYCTDREHKQFGKMVASSQGPKDRIMHTTACSSSSGDYVFFSCGEKHAIVWSLSSKYVLKAENCKFADKNQIFLSSAALPGGVVVMSTQSGELFQVNLASKQATAISSEAGFTHAKSAINALHIKGDKLFSGDKDGKVIVWGADGGQIHGLFQFKLTGYCQSGGGEAAGAVPSVRALCLSPDNTRLLVGTQTCEIIEYTLSAGTFASLSAKAAATVVPKNLVIGHFHEEVWALAVRPITEQNCMEGVQYATGGDDRFLRIWDLNTHRMLTCVQLPAATRACTYSPDGMYLALGLGGGRKVGKAKSKDSWDGSVKIFRLESAINQGVVSVRLIAVADIRDAKQSISAIQYSPDGTLLAVGARDNSIYMYSVPNQYKRKYKFSKHNAGINQFDFSACGRYMQSCCSAYEILFSDTTTGAQVTDGATKFMETDWQSWTCTLGKYFTLPTAFLTLFAGWPVIGIWSGTMDGTDVNSVDRSPSHRYMATSDDFGKVNLFNCPALAPKGAAHAAFTGHSSHVTCVRWASSYPTESKRTAFATPRTDDYLISIGGEDKCVFQWKHSDPFGKDAALSSKSPRAEAGSPSTVDANDIDIGLPTGGDEFTAVKPWLGAIVAPTPWSTPDPQKAPPFIAALGEYSNFLRTFQEDTDSRKVAEKYTGLQQIADTVLQRMYESGVSDPSPPSGDDLDLAWVHGYRGFDCRNNVFFVNNGMGRLVVYYAAALGIVLDPLTREQRYFRGHQDDILAMTVFEMKSTNQVLVATGQQGMASIFIWEVPSMQTLAVLPTKQKTVQFLSFSADGRLLVALSEDLQICVYDWKTQSMLSSTKVDGSVVSSLQVLGMGSSTPPSSLQFFTAGDKLLRLWTLQGRNITSTKYVTSTCGGTTIQLFLCVVEILSKFYVGCEDGSVYIIPLEGKGVTGRFNHSDSTPVKADDGKKGKGDGKAAKNPAVTAMHVFTSAAKSFLFTGAKDGSIVLWDASEVNINPKPLRLFSFNIDAVGTPDIMAKQIQNISAKQINASSLLLVVGTRGCDLLEVMVSLDKQSAALHVNAQEPMKGVLVRGHCNDELWGVATHPSLPEYCTVGDDKTLRFYDLHSFEMKLVIPLGHISRTVEYNSTGNMLALGFGGRVGKGKEAGGGIVRVYSADWRSPAGVVKLAERKDAKQWISDIKFTPDGHSVVAGAHDCKIYIYDLAQGKKGEYELRLRNTFSKHNSVINHLDLSADGRYMQSNCSAYELLFCDVSNGKHVTSATELKDVKWSSWTCTLGWPVQGIWAAGMDGSDINAVARSHTGHLLATSDDFGQVHLFRYPVTDKNAKSLAFKGHSSHVMNVRWSCGDEYLISAGGGDKCIFQWKHRLEDGGSFASPTLALSKSSKKVKMAGYESDSDASSVAESSYGVEDELEAPGGGDESGCVKPWLGAVRAPKNPPPVSAAAPAVDLSLQWVYGYSSSVAYSRPNLFYSGDGDIVYPAAALAVSLQRSGHPSQADWKQSYLRGHDDDVLCLTISADRRFVATGQIASKALKGKASVIIWSTEGRLLSKMDGCHQRGVHALAFSPDASKLVSVGMDDAYSHTVWADMGGNWSRVQQIATAKGDKQPTLFLHWVHPENPFQREVSFVSGGSKVVSLWRIEGSTLSKKQASNKKAATAATTPLAYLSMANLQMKGGWKVVLGSSTGDLLILDKELTVQVDKAHAKAIFALAACEIQSVLVSGGKDCFVRIWNQSLQMISALDLQSCQAVHSFDPIVLSLDTQHQGDDSLHILAGTAGGEVIELVVPGKAGKEGDKVSYDLAKASPAMVACSHSKGELWGLATHPLDADIFATVGDDATLRVWSIKKHACLQAVSLPRAARCVAWHPLGSILAVGLQEDKKANAKLRKGKGGKKKAGKAEPIEEGDEEEDRKPSSAAFDNDGGVQVFSFRAPTPSQAAELQLRAVGCFPATHPQGSFVSVSDIKFSPSGDQLFLSSHDCKLRGYALPSMTAGDIFSRDSHWEDYSHVLGAAPAFVFDKHSSTVTHFDCSMDGAYLQSTDLGNELLFYDLRKHKQEPSASKVADYNNQLDDEEEHEARLWATQTSVFGWSVQGIWPATAYDSSDINAVDRHHAQKLLATGEDSGQIRILRFPSVVPNSHSVVLLGHSSHVTNVRWAMGSQLLSVGGNDKCVFVWEMQEK